MNLDINDLKITPFHKCRIGGDKSLIGFKDNKKIMVSVQLLYYKFDFALKRAKYLEHKKHVEIEYS